MPAAASSRADQPFTLERLEQRNPVRSPRTGFLFGEGGLRVRHAGSLTPPLGSSATTARAALTFFAHGQFVYKKGDISEVGAKCRFSHFALSRLGSVGAGQRIYRGRDQFGFYLNFHTL